MNINRSLTINAWCGRTNLISSCKSWNVLCNTWWIVLIVHCLYVKKSLNYIFSSYKAIKSLHTSWDKPLNSYGLILQSLYELFEASKWCFFFQILQRRHLSKCHGCTGVPGTRRRGTSFEHFNFHTEIAGEQVHTKMTLILDKDTGNTEDL